tara:strand:- start:468 stop:827 length:360 start_codon:yes stop_codon:yes gene_type:complete
MKIKKNKVIDLKKKGKILKFYYGNEKFLKKIKEVYFSEVPHDINKDWKFHENRNQIMTVIKGEILFQYKKKKNDKPKKIKLSFRNNPLKIYIPKKTFYTFSCISKTNALIANIIDENVT